MAKDVSRIYLEVDHFGLQRHWNENQVTILTLFVLYDETGNIPQWPTQTPGANQP